MVSYHQIGKCLPYASAQTIQVLHKVMCNCSARILPADLREARLMAQRTLMGLYSPINLDFYIEQIYRFWSSYLTYFRIDLVVSAITPHSLTDYILALASKDLGIRFVCQCAFNVRNHSLFLDFSQIFIRNDIESDTCQTLKEFLLRLKSGDANIVTLKNSKLVVNTDNPIRVFA